MVWHGLIPVGLIFKDLYFASYQHEFFDYRCDIASIKWKDTATKIKFKKFSEFGSRTINNSSNYNEMNEAKTATNCSIVIIIASVSWTKKRFGHQVISENLPPPPVIQTGDCKNLKMLAYQICFNSDNFLKPDLQLITSTATKVFCSEHNDRQLSLNMLDRKWSKFHVVFTKILCCRNFRVW